MVLGEQIPDPGIRGGMERLVGAEAIGPHANDHADAPLRLAAHPADQCDRGQRHAGGL